MDYISKNYLLIVWFVSKDNGEKVFYKLPPPKLRVSKQNFRRLKHMINLSVKPT